MFQSSKQLFFLLRILLRSADNLQNVKKEKFVFLLWLSASLPEAPKESTPNSTPVNAVETPVLQYLLNTAVLVT